jgi:hypothetical protein
MNPDAWEEIIRRRLTTLMRKKPSGIDGDIALATNDNGNREWRVSTSFILRDALSISPERQGDAVTKRLAGVMRSLAWTRPDNVIRIGKAQPCRGFTLVEVEPKAVEVEQNRLEREITRPSLPALRYRRIDC